MSLSKIPPIKIPGTQYSLIGHSWAAKNTCFYVPELKIMLDCGIESDKIPDNVFITHGHSDHSKDIPMTIVQLSSFKSQHQKLVNIHVPIEILGYVRNYIDAFYVMSKNNPKHRAHTKYNLIPVEIGMRIPMIIRNTKYIVEIIKCFHSVPCVGYGFIEVRKRLKQEYRNMATCDIIMAKKGGIDINEEYEHPMFCYLGDTDDYVFANEETKLILAKYNVIITECTFITSDQIQQAKQKKHIYIEHIDGIIRAELTKTFILYHFSDRYDEQEIINFFIKKGYTNVIPWVSIANNNNMALLPWGKWLHNYVPITV